MGVKFTKRQLDAIRYGTLTNAQAAQELGISQATLHNHWSDIYAKLRAAGVLPQTTNKRIIALKYAAQEGFVDLKQLPREPRGEEIW